MIKACQNSAVIFPCLEFQEDATKAMQVYVQENDCYRNILKFWSTSHRKICKNATEFHVDDFFSDQLPVLLSVKSK